VIHYHGTPITPKSSLMEMRGKFFCCSFARPDNAKDLMHISQGILWDNGAYTTFTKGKKFDLTKYYNWLEDKLGHPHWAIIPDSIEGGEEAQQKLISTWPYQKELGAPVWHLHESLEWLRGLATEWPRICFGSSRQYWEIGTRKWENRVDQAFNTLAQMGPLPWIHMLRGMSCGGKRWPFSSVDSCNVATTHRGQGRNKVKNIEYMARTIDSVQSPLRWTPRPEQRELISET
jgi:hypothetical protein